MNRRAFLGVVAAATAGGASSVTRGAQRAGARMNGAESAADAAKSAPSRVKGIAFDGFPIIDPRPVAARAEEMFPGKGEALMSAWRTRQFEYTWLRTLGGHYADFWHTTQDALVFAASSLGMTLEPQARDRLMHTCLELKAWPDVLPALQKLKAAKLRMVFLSNFTASMLDAAVENAGLQGFFEPHLSTDRVQAYKPDPRAYAMALSAFGVSRDEIVFVPSAAWDAAGAKWFGYPTFWVNRAGAPAEELSVQVDAAGSGMNALADFVLARV